MDEFFLMQPINLSLDKSKDKIKFGKNFDPTLHNILFNPYPLTRIKVLNCFLSVHLSESIPLHFSGLESRMKKRTERNANFGKFSVQWYPVPEESQSRNKFRTFSIFIKINFFFKIT